MKLYTVTYLEKDDKILMLYRNKKENDINKGKWIGVGGHIEEFESPYESAIREIKEETGFIANSLDYRGLITFKSDDNDVEYIFVFSTEDFSGEMIECDEGDLHWIDRNKIFELNIWEGDKDFLDKIINKDKNVFMVKSTYVNNKLVKRDFEI
ncbi:NUDIX hydrolase [Oceanivirga salmonicida]|uniref:NUDIX hydrolase n=1 Tax=Oceanivirga salmonicida TaxID=1769291 RepID=UPI00082C4A86|nr:8-oxo-dGTP diphosphatase [Oceanivirga salmonicida]